MKDSKQVYTTTQYSLFKSISGNRTKNLIHLNRLKKSMSENYLFTIIIVNEKNEIIDGQHRFDVIKELKLPLHYIICNGYGLNEVHLLNQNSKIWTTADYLEGYSNMGYSDYVEFKKFAVKNKINNQIAMYLLSGKDGGRMGKEFNSGQFKIKNLNESQEKMDKLHLCGEYFPQYKTRWFVFAMERLFRNSNFNFNEFLKKLKIQPTALKPCIDVAQYLSLIEEIYNYRRGEKVNLRY
tara:strand:- start:4326 stop:5039 length:714 start_codon:yes stop_codon:yes gene_type:complete